MGLGGFAGGPMPGQKPGMNEEELKQAEQMMKGLFGAMGGETGEADPMAALFKNLGMQMDPANHK